MTSRGGRDASREGKWDRGERGASGDGATGRSVKAFQFGNVGNA